MRTDLHYLDTVDRRTLPVTFDDDIIVPIERRLCLLHGGEVVAVNVDD